MLIIKAILLVIILKRIITLTWYHEGIADGKLKNSALLS
jgi:hypothetical protein